MLETVLSHLKLDFGATADSDGALGSNLIREARSKQFSIRKYAFGIQELCPNRKAVANMSLL